MTTGMRRIRMGAGTVLLLLGGLAAWVMYAYGLAVEMDHSRSWTSDSIADARRRDVLVRLPELEDSIFLYAGRPLRVREAWIEEVTQVRYRAYLPGTRRVVNLGTHRLLLHVVDPDGTPLLSQDLHYLAAALCVSSAPDRVTRLGSTTGAGLFFASIGTTLPHRIAVHAGPPGCPEPAIGAGL
jgi:fermentation-respiration switch protein FrsA (DUF1100 family)